MSYRKCTNAVNNMFPDESNVAIRTYISDWLTPTKKII